MNRRSSVVTAAVIAVVAIVQLLDLATCVPAVAHVGIGAESNPVARILYGLAGGAGLAALKLAAILVVLAALGLVARRHPARLVLAAAVPALLGVAGVASNVLRGLVG